MDNNRISTGNKVSAEELKKRYAEKKLKKIQESESDRRSFLERESSLQQENSINSKDVEKEEIICKNNFPFESKQERASEVFLNNVSVQFKDLLITEEDKFVEKFSETIILKEKESLSDLKEKNINLDKNRNNLNEPNKKSEVEKNIYLELIQFLDKNDYDSFFYTVEEKLIGRSEVNYYELFNKHSSLFDSVIFRRWQFPLINLNQSEMINNKINLSNILKKIGCGQKERDKLDGNFNYYKINKTQILDNYSNMSLLAISYLEICVLNETFPSFSSLLKDKYEMKVINKMFNQSFNFEELNSSLLKNDKIFNNTDDEVEKKISLLYNSLNIETIEQITNLFRYSIKKSIMSYLKLNSQIPDIIRNSDIWRAYKFLIEPNCEDINYLINYMSRNFKLEDTKDEIILEENLKKKKVSKFNYNKKEEMTQTPDGEEDQRFIKKIFKKNINIYFSNINKLYSSNSSLIERYQNELEIIVFIDDATDTRLFIYNLGRKANKLNILENIVESQENIKESIQNSKNSKNINLLKLFEKSFEDLVSDYKHFVTKEMKFGNEAGPININIICNGCYKQTEIVKKISDSIKFCGRCFNNYQNENRLPINTGTLRPVENIYLNL
jgi:hypothetical protein